MEAELGRDTGVVDGVAAIMARPIRHELNQACVRALLVRYQRVDDRAKGVDDLQIGVLATPPML